MQLRCVIYAVCVSLGISRNTICFGLLLGTDTLPFAYILKRRAAKCVPHMRLDNAPAECTYTQRGKVNARRSVFTVTQARRDYVCFVNKTYKYENRLPDRLCVVASRGIYRDYSQGCCSLLFSVAITGATDTL